VFVIAVVIYIYVSLQLDHIVFVCSFIYMFCAVWLAAVWSKSTMLSTTSHRTPQLR